MSRLFKAIVKENKELLDNHFLLSVHPLDKVHTINSGNFFMLSTGDGTDPLLKRPFSIHRLNNGNLQFLYRVVGRGTDILSKKNPGDIIEIAGPLGNSFPLKSSQKNIILVAGGLGIAPIYGLAEEIFNLNLTRKKRNPYKIIFFYGAKKRDQTLCIDKLNALGIDPVISSDDGSIGYKGNIVTVMKRYMAKNKLKLRDYTIFGCGPEKMLESLSSYAVADKASGYIALEQSMACGLGTCLGCVVNTKKGYKRVCKEGPVFPVEEIIW